MENEDTSILHKRTNKTLQRHKVIYSLFLCGSYLTCGWNLGQIGSALLDLQEITSVTLTEASLYQTFFSFGLMVGSLLYGAIYKHIHTCIIQCWSFLFAAIALVALPWCRLHVAMVTAHFVVGSSDGFIAAGDIITGAICVAGDAYSSGTPDLAIGFCEVINADMLAAWGTSGRSFMQFMHVCFALGGIIAPIITVPFLSSRSQDDVINWNNVSSAVTRELPLNSTEFVMQTNISSSDASRLYYAYIISAIINVIIGVAYLVMYFTFPIDGILSGRDESDITSTKTLSKNHNILVLVNMGVMAGVYIAFEETFSGFLNAFCVHRFNWSTSDGSYATSTFYGCFGLGGLVAVIWVSYLNPKKTMEATCVLIILSVTNLLLCGIYLVDIGVWISAASTGLVVAAMYPTVFTWTEEDFLPVTGIISSYFIIMSALGGTINPLLMGFLMDEYSPLWYPCLLLGEACVLLVLCITASLLSRTVNTNNKMESEETKSIGENNSSNHGIIHTYLQLLRSRSKYVHIPDNLHNNDPG